MPGRSVPNNDYCWQLAQGTLAQSAAVADEEGRRAISQSPPASSTIEQQPFHFPSTPGTPRRMPSMARRQPRSSVGQNSSPLHVAALFASAAKAAIGGDSNLLRDESVTRLFMNPDEVFKAWEKDTRIRASQQDARDSRKQSAEGPHAIKKISSMGTGDALSRDIARKRATTVIQRAQSIDIEAAFHHDNEENASVIADANAALKQLPTNKWSTGSAAAVLLSDRGQIDDLTRRRSTSIQQKTGAVRRFSGAISPNDANIKKVALDNDYNIRKQLGTGRFGYVKLAEHKQSKMKIVLKFFSTPQTKLVDFLREYNFSRFLSPHPNILDTFDGVFQTDDESAFFFVQEFCPRGSLRELVEATTSAHPPGLGDATTKTVMLKVISAVEFMHGEGLVHRNLKAENILIFDPDHHNRIKLTDFGLTRPSESTVKHLECINHYQAPELCETVVNETVTISKSTDIWALGVLMAYCLKGKFPWQKATIMCKPYWEWDQWMKHKSPQLPKYYDPLNEKALKLFKHCLNPRAKDRWNIKDMKKCVEKERFLKLKVSIDDLVYYPDETNTSSSSTKSSEPARQHKKSVIGQWINTMSNTMSEISDQVVSARDE